MYFIIGHKDENLINSIAHWCNTRIHESNQVFMSTQIALKVSIFNHSFRNDPDTKTIETYGNLDFTLANSEILLVVYIHSFKSIPGAVVSLYKENYRKSAWIIDDKKKLLIIEVELEHKI